jgi:hypothetical protein
MQVFYMRCGDVGLVLFYIIVNIMERFYLRTYYLLARTPAGIEVGRCVDLGFVLFLMIVNISERFLFPVNTPYGYK